MTKLLHIIWRLVLPPLIYQTIQLVIAMLFLYGCAFYLHSLELAGNLLNQYALLLTVLAALITLPILFWLFNRDVQSRRTPSTPPPGLGQTLVWCAALGLGLCLVLNVLLSLSGLLLHFNGYESISARLYAPPFWQQLLTTALILPLCEEMIFRALMFRGMREEMAFWPAAVLSSLAFAIAHGNVYQGVYAFCLGLFMAWVYERTQVLLAPVLLHTFANLLSIILANSTVSAWLMGHLTLYGLGVGAMFILTILSLYRIHRRTVCPSP